MRGTGEERECVDIHMQFVLYKQHLLRNENIADKSLPGIQTNAVHYF